MTKEKENKNFKWWLVKSIYASLFFIIIVFTYTKTHNIFTGTNLKINIDKNTDGIMTITGQASNAVLLTLDDREIFIDKKGNFDEQVAILPGLSTVTVVARDKFGNVSNKKFEVFYKEKVEVALTK